MQHSILGKILSIIGGSLPTVKFVVVAQNVDHVLLHLGSRLVTVVSELVSK